jgi:hypothetical protein
MTENGGGASGGAGGGVAGGAEVTGGGTANGGGAADSGTAEPDGGSLEVRHTDIGCGCKSVPGAVVLPVLLVLCAALRARIRRNRNLPR